MNPLDVAFAAGCVLAALGGWRLGLIRRVVGWIGLIAGLLVASQVLPLLITTAAQPAPADLLKSLGVITIGGVGGQALGVAVGTRIRRLITTVHVGVLDSVAGGVLGVAGVVVAMWMIVPAMVQIPGWPADAARSSTVAARLSRSLGDPPDVFGGVSKALGVPGLGTALQGVGAQVDPTAPTNLSLPDDVFARASASTVKLSGPACGRLQSGSGFVIERGYVVTNAHVIAGNERITVTTADGTETEGTARYFDPKEDVAVVWAPGLDREPLPLIEPVQGGDGAVLGYPGGGPLAVQPYDVAALTTATSNDIYDEGSFPRDILVLGSRIGPGDSGGPMVDVGGAVAGIVFGIAPDDDQTAYAVPSSKLRPALVKAQARENGLPATRCRA